MERPNDVPYIVYEGAEARSERMIKRLIVALIISIALLFATNIIWLVHDSKYDTITYEQDGEGLNNVNIGEQGGLRFNVTESYDQKAP